MPLPTAGSKNAPLRPTLLSSRSSACLHFLAKHADASGSGVRDALRMHRLSQASRLLARLERGGLVEKHKGRRENHWRLTNRGQAVLNEQDAAHDIVAPPPIKHHPAQGAGT